MRTTLTLIIPLALTIFLGGCAKPHRPRPEAKATAVAMTDADRERAYYELEGDITRDITHLRKLDEHGMDGGMRLKSMFKFLNQPDVENRDEIRETLTLIRGKANRQISLAKKINDEELREHAELTKFRAERRLEELGT